MDTTEKNKTIQTIDDPIEAILEELDRMDEEEERQAAAEFLNDHPGVLAALEITQIVFRHKILLYMIMAALNMPGEFWGQIRDEVQEMLEIAGDARVNFIPVRANEDAD